MKVGYVRCSIAEQNEVRQMKMMENQRVEKVFVDKASGKNVDHKDFKAVMAFVREGDTMIVESISRIARNTRDLLSIISELTEKGVEFVSLKENIDTTTPHGLSRSPSSVLWQNWSVKVSWNASVKVSISQKLRANTKAANLSPSTKPNLKRCAPAGAPVKSLLLPQ